MKRLILCAGLLLGACTTASDTYVKADRATYDAIVPDYINYVQADNGLTQEQKDRRMRLVWSWQKRIEAAEGVSK